MVPGNTKEESMSKFLKLAAVDTARVAKDIEGNSYIPWATGLAMAGNPSQTVVMFPSTGLVRPLFGGGVVAVDQVTEGGQSVQRTWLPIQNKRGGMLPYTDLNCRDIGNEINRCRMRSISTVSGLGISLYSPCGTDGESYVAALAVTPSVDLSKVAPLVEQKKDKKTGRVISEYLGWFSALSAARITDPNFHWEVLEFEVVDPATGVVQTLPAQRAPAKGWLVAVALTWKGRRHVEWLPIMGVQDVETKKGIKALEHQPLPDPDVLDWHKATMRALAKGIAITTGYGLSLYADEVAAVGGVDSEDLAEDAGSSSEQTQRPSKATVSAAAAGSEAAQVSPLVKEVEDLIKKKGAQLAQVLSFLRTDAVANGAPHQLEEIKRILAARPNASAGASAGAAVH